MKKIYFAFLFVLVAFNANSQEPFITTWEVESSDLSITIPTTGTGYNYTVDFGDGTVQNNVTGNVLHIYDAPGVYTVSISGDFPRIYFSDLSPFEANNLKSIEQWGDQVWTSMEGAFEDCENLIINATDAPDLSIVTDMGRMFRKAENLNQPISQWDVSNITDMSQMFEAASLFNQPLDNWDVSNVTNMEKMFSASGFNQPINNWDVSSVLDMSSMFNNQFSQSLSNWDVSNVTDMSLMFSSNEFFNQPLDNWDVSNVVDMSQMFLGSIYNQPLNSWDVSNVTDMSLMFSSNEFFNQPLDNWDVSNVVNMKGIFSSAKFFEQPLDSWNVSNVTNMSEMFQNAINFNQPLSNWDVLNVTDMSYMFESAIIFNQNIGNWDVSNVTDMSFMFAVSFYDFGEIPYHKFNQAIGNWSVSNVVNMEKMFANSEFNQDINSWNVSNVTNMKSMFASTNSFNLPLDSWDVSNVVSMQGMFSNAQNFNQDLSSWSFNNNVSLDNFIFNTKLNISNYEILLNRFRILNLQNKNLNAESLFYCNDTDRLHLVNDLGWNIVNDNKIINCSPLAPGAFVTRWEIPSSDLTLIISFTDPGYNYTIDLGDGTVLTNQTSNVFYTYSTPGVYNISITGSFPRIELYSESQLLSVEQWGNIQWTTMQGAFVACSNLKINATDAPDLSQATDMSQMFQGCHFNQSINHWDVSNVTNMSGLFAGMESFNQPLDNWDVSNVTDMSHMFDSATAFNQPLNNWDVANVNDMYKMFSEAKSFDQPIDDWDVSSVTNMSSMFEEVISFNQPLNDWDVSNVSDMNGMFRYAYYFNQTLNTWDVSSVTNIDEMFMGTNFFNQSLNNWNVSNITFMSSVFAGAENFNQPLNNWDVSNITGFYYTFSGAISFNQPLDNWNVSNAQSFVRMFNSAKSFNQSLNDWDVSNAGNMNGMFSYAEDFNQPLDNWDVSNAFSMEGMFWGAKSFDQSVNNWDVSNVGIMDRMFSDADDFNQPLDNWDVSNVNDMGHMFNNAAAFNQSLNNWDVSGVADMSSMFQNADLFNQDLSGWEINTVDLHNFLTNSGMDVVNYDNLLSSLAVLGNPDGALGADGLEYCNTSARDYLLTNLGWYIHEDSQSFNCNLITGMVLFDETNNGCDANDIGITGFMVNANDGVDDFTTFSINGIYNIGTLGTSFTVSLINYPDYFTADPVSANVVFTGSNTEVVDFCVTANQSIADLNITLLPITQARPGFEAGYQLVVENRGTENVANVDISLVFDDAKQAFLVASPAPTSTTANELVFEVANLPPFGQMVFNVTMQTFAPPIVEGGDVLNFTANVAPNTNDNTPEDNTFVFEQIVVNSFDPNDKQVLQGEEIYLEEVDEYLHYIIRFQNTGTASAINIRVLDTLHPKLDWTTILPINASHDYHVEITEGNRVEFIFDDINLPHTEPESHGFVAYKIKPENDVQVGDVITGDASIYFDFNPPIITNTISTTIVDNLSVGENSQTNVSIYPVPSNDVLNIRSVNAITEVQVYNEFGQLLINRKEAEGISQINIEKLSPGLYFIKLKDGNDNMAVKKFIKE